ncbi:MAG: hypothetical protein KGZ96_05760 [Clostridia bacterium]|nr:hypothetical protein [Clostridia bacterium]
MDESEVSKVTPKVQISPNFLQKRRQEQKALLNELDQLEQQLTELEVKARVHKPVVRVQKLTGSK